MVSTPILVVGRCRALDLALAAVEHLALPIRVMASAGEAARELAAGGLGRLAAVLVGLDQEPAQGLELVRAIRKEGPSGVPIVVWVTVPRAHLIPAAYGLGASSGVLLPGTHEDPMMLARTVYYWAVANEPNTVEAPGVTGAECQ